MHLLSPCRNEQNEQDEHCALAFGMFGVCEQNEQHPLGVFVMFASILPPLM